MGIVSEGPKLTAAQASKMDRPSLVHSRRPSRLFRSRDMSMEAATLEGLATNASWLHDRAMQHGLPREAGTELCQRCKESIDTPLHRLWACRCSNDIDN